MNLLLIALNIEVPPQQESAIVQKILADHFVNTKCMEAMIASLVVEVVRGLHPLEKSALVKRLDVPKKRIGAVWTLYDMTQAIEKSTPYSFGLKAACATCHNERFFSSARPWWKRIKVMNGTQETFKEEYTLPTRDDVKKVLESVVWTHCGIVDRPAEDMLLTFQARMSEIVGG
jgi:hypothetical protein